MFANPISIILRFLLGEKPHPCPVCFKPFRMRSDMKRHMQMHARDGSDVSLLLACAEQGIDPLEAITADPDALAALREKTANSNEAKTTAPRGARGRKVCNQCHSDSGLSSNTPFFSN